MLDPERVESTMGIRGLLRCIPVLLVALITFVAFSPALRNGFVNWDDLETLVENQNFRGLSWSHLVWMFVTGVQRTASFEALTPRRGVTT